MNIRQMKNALQHPAMSWIRRTCKKAFRPAAYLLLITTVLFSVIPAPAGSKDIGGKRTLDTMTMNLYIGAGVERILAVDPTDTDALLETVTSVYYELLASNPQARLNAVADQIAARKPDIVAVEEATLLRIQSPGDLAWGGTDPATDVVFDYLQILVDALNARGAHYAVASTSNEWDIEMPMYHLDEYGNPVGIDDVRQTDREAILVRTDLPRGELTVSNPRNGNFTNTIDMIPGISLTRGWCSVDVTTRGQKFRYISTHLEEELYPKIQVAQALELLLGPAKTAMPVIVVGDFNSDPFGRDGSGGYAYKTMTKIGRFTDTWGELHPRNPAGGLTWGHDEYLADPSVHFDRRIDFVFFRGSNFDPISAEPIDIKIRHTMGQPPLWASDHAAVFASLEIDTAPCPKDRKK
jgi:endonuclease/exonuclease/phosphatase family metal-dependent hydrolase